MKPGFLGPRCPSVRWATSQRLPGVWCAGHPSCTQKLLKVLVFFLSPPGQSEGGARRDPGEWGRESPGSPSRVPRDRKSASGGPFAPSGGLHPATQGLTRFGHRRTAQHKAGRPGLVGWVLASPSAPAPRSPRAQERSLPAAGAPSLPLVCGQGRSGPLVPWPSARPRSYYIMIPPCAARGRL